MPDAPRRADAPPRSVDAARLGDAPADAAPMMGWTRVGTLDRWPGKDASDLVVEGSAILAPLVQRRWDLATAASADAPFATDPSVSFRRRGCACLIGTRSFIAGGGGDGVTGAWDERTFLEADLTARTLVSHAQPFAAQAVACAAAGDSCLLIGGDTGPGGPTGSAAVRVFDRATAMFRAGPPLPGPTAAAAVAVGAGKVLVAGGYCGGGAPCAASNDPSGMEGTVLTTVSSLEIGGTTWQVEPSLPRPVARGGLVFVDGRFHLVGGSGSIRDATTDPNGVLSWAPGDAAWRADGPVPGTGPVIQVFTDGASIFIAVAEANFEFSLYRKN